MPVFTGRGVPGLVAAGLLVPDEHGGLAIAEKGVRLRRGESLFQLLTADRFKTLISYGDERTADWRIGMEK